MCGGLKCRRCGDTGHFVRVCPVARASFAEVARGANGPSSSGISGPAATPKGTDPLSNKMI